MTKTDLIKERIHSYLDEGMTKADIYTRIVEELGVPRPTVRRVARDLRDELQAEADALRFGFAN